tara:strand:- start:3511 stop:4047 length:537 start_codon:yes stop_codon:yes gene_type:complete
VKLYKKNITFLLSGKGSNLLRILKQNLIKEKFNTHSIISNNYLSQDIKNLIRLNKLDLKIYENISSISLKMVEGTDVIFSIGYMKIITKKIINNYDVINLHPSLLPKYKGLMTQKRMLINNEKYYGFTIHSVSPLLDSGQIIYQKENKIKKNDELLLNSDHKKLEHQYVFKELVKYLN